MLVKIILTSRFSGNVFLVDVFIGFIKYRNGLYINLSDELLRLLQ